MNEPTNKTKKKWPAVLGCVAGALVLIMGSGWLYYQSKLDRLNYDDGKRELDVTTELPLDDLEIPELERPAPENEDELRLPEGDIFSDENVLNVLLLGTDERTPHFSDNARADAIMIASVNREDHTGKLVSIERGIGVPIEGRSDDWITHTFRYGGAALTLKTVQDCFNLDVERYVRVNFHAFIQGIDAIGGIDIEVTQAEADCMNAPDANSLFGPGIQEVHAGVNHMNGATALSYARTRQLDSDWKRIERQRAVVQAAIRQVMHSDLATLNRLADTILPMVQTNFTKSEITALLLELPGFLTSDVKISQMTIPPRELCWNRTSDDGRSLIGVDFAENARILREFLYS